MTTSISRLAAAVAVVFVALAVFFTASTAHAQLNCPNITVTNNSGCDLRLAIYDNSVPPVTVQFHVPTTGAVLNFPPGFFAMGCVSNAGTLIPAPGVPVGCTACFACPKWGPPGAGTCCVEVCGNTMTCNANINSCPSPCIP